MWLPPAATMEPYDFGTRMGNKQVLRCGVWTQLVGLLSVITGFLLLPVLPSSTLRLTRVGSIWPRGSWWVFAKLAGPLGNELIGDDARRALWETAQFAPLGTFASRDSQSPSFVPMIARLPRFSFALSGAKTRAPVERAPLKLGGGEPAENKKNWPPI